MNILCLGDVVGKPGRAAIQALLDGLKKEFAIDFVIINAENAAGGAGITSRIARGMLHNGCDVITLGDHTWDQKDIEPFLNETDQVIRPANFPVDPAVPGKGWTIRQTASGIKVGVINVLGRTFMRIQVDCPFRKINQIIETIQKETSIIIIDFHAETTSEKVACGHFVNGKASLVFGTHTHIQTADEKILSEGTAHITDLGMCGPYDSVIGQDKNAIMQRFLTSMPFRFSVASGDIKVCGVVVDIDEKTGKARKIQRIMRSFEAKDVDLAEEKN